MVFSIKPPWYIPLNKNAKFKCKHFHILNVARSLLFQTFLSKSLGESVKIVVYLINRTLSPLLKYKFSFEMLFNKPYSHLHVLGVYVVGMFVPQTNFMLEAPIVFF